MVVALAIAGVVITGSGDDRAAGGTNGDGVADTLREFGRQAASSQTATDLADSVSETDVDVMDDDSSAVPDLDFEAGAVLPLPADSDAVAGADPRRLPDEAPLRWTRPIDVDATSIDDVESSVLAIDSRFVAVVWSAGGARLVGESVLDVHDAGTGDLVWSVGLPARASAFDLVGADDETLFVESPLRDRRLAAFSLADGTERWVHAEAPGEFGIIGEAAGFELLAGSPLIARRPVVEENPTLLFDPETGETVGQLDGQVIGRDGVGNLHTVLDGDFSTHDLSGGFSTGRPKGSIWSPEGTGDVVEGRLVQPGGDRIFVTEADSVALTIAVIDADTNGVDVPSTVSAVSAMTGSTMLISGAGEVVGAELVGNVIRPAWRRTGAAQALYPTEQGHLVLLATQGGAAMDIVDGRSGRTLFALTLAAGALQTLEVAGNGFVGQRLSQLGPRLGAIDLDGNEMWSLVGSGPLSVGDGVVGRVEFGAVGAVLAAYG